MESSGPAMITSMRSLTEGIRVALATPSHIERGLPELIEPFGGNGGVVSDPAFAIKAAHRVLRLLARIPGGRWRNTCLYRSVAECLLLRAHGIDARLCIGVESQQGATAGVGAHAWVETDEKYEVTRSDPPKPSTVRLVDSRPGRPD